VPNESSGWAEIRHPFHPHRGQRFAVIRARRVSGVDTVILRDPELGSFAVPREWTDLAAPHFTERVDGSTQRLEVYLLCDLVTLIDAVVVRSRGGLAK
jgi:Family of unknown function (DUF5372)